MWIYYRYADERKQIECKTEEAKKLNNVLIKKMEEEKELKEKLADNMKYSDYLSRFVDHMQRSTNDFSEVQDILNRFKTLQDARRYLTDGHQQNISLIEKKQIEYSEYIKDISNSHLNHSNDLVSLQKKLDSCCFKSNELQNVVDADITVMNEKTAELGQLLYSIDNTSKQFDDSAAIWKAKPQNQGKCAPHGASSTIESTTHESLEITEMSVNRAMDKLDRIADYIIDYSQVVEYWQSIKQ